MPILTADKRGQTDGPAHRMLQGVQSGVPIILMSRTDGFKFNEELLSLDKYVLVEFSELGWDWDIEGSGTHIWGVNTKNFPQFNSEEYAKFADFVSSNPPILTLTRELLKKDVTNVNKPIDYPCWFTLNEPVSKDEFEQRPLSAFNFWGRSHEARLTLHANIWKAASEHGFSVCDNPYFLQAFLEQEKGQKWASFFMPWYSRVDIKEILSVNSLAKLSFALPGAGIKTFRHCEASYNSVMIKWEDKLAWAYPWEHEKNCITTFPNQEIIDATEAINKSNLYDIYCAGIENCRKYQIDNYISNYIQPIINEL